MTVQTTTVPWITFYNSDKAADEAYLDKEKREKKLARAKARYNRLHAQYKAHPTEGSRLALIKALEKMRDIERSAR